MKKLACVLCVLMMFILGLGSPAQESRGFKVVINAENPTTEFDKSRVAKMFLKKLPRWPEWEGAERVMPIDLLPDSPVREAFSEAVHGRSVSTIKSYWQRMIFSGREVPPEEVATDAQVLTFVSREPTAIGYVAQDTQLGPDVKELTVTD